MNATFAAALRRGSQDAQRMMGESFIWNGCEYTGVFTQAIADFSMEDGGHNNHCEYTLRAIRSQFGGSYPVARSDSIQWRGASWLVRSTTQEANEHVFVATVRRRE